MEHDNFQRSEYFRACYKSIGTHDELGFFIRLRPGHYIVVLFGRYLGKPEFANRTLRRLDQIWPLVSSSVRRQWDSLQLDESATPPADPFGALTECEREIALMILQGFSSEEIALHASISPQTIKVHRRNIYSKLRISSAMELFRKYLVAAPPPATDGTLTATL